MSHRIRKLSFGTEFPGVINPLDDHKTIDSISQQGKCTRLLLCDYYCLVGGLMYQYFIKVVPTVYKHINEETMITNQFAVTKHERSVKAATGEHGLPGQYE